MIRFLWRLLFGTRPVVVTYREPMSDMARDRLRWHIERQYGRPVVMVPTGFYVEG